MSAVPEEEAGHGGVSAVLGDRSRLSPRRGLETMAGLPGEAVVLAGGRVGVLEVILVGERRNEVAV